MSPNHALRSLVYEVVKAAGLEGLRYSQVVEKVRLTCPDVSDKAVHGHLMRLCKAELMSRSGRGHFLVDDGCAKPGALLVSPQERLLELIADCPGGVSDAVLAEESGMSRWRVGRYLKECVAQGLVRRIQIPATHGGGWGYDSVAQPQITAGADAVINSAKAFMASLDEASPHTAPAGTTDEAKGEFRLLDQSRLVMAWDGARIVLPPAVTLGLLRYLDALGAQGATS